jgi:hypothetical protein
VVLYESTCVIFNTSLFVPSSSEEVYTGVLKFSFLQESEDPTAWAAKFPFCNEECEDPTAMLHHLRRRDGATGGAPSSPPHTHSVVAVAHLAAPLLHRRHVRAAPLLSRWRARSDVVFVVVLSSSSPPNVGTSPSVEVGMVVQRRQQSHWLDSVMPQPLVCTRIEQEPKAFVQNKKNQIIQFGKLEGLVSSGPTVVRGNSAPTRALFLRSSGV